MKIRVVSDLHIDINNTNEFGFSNKLDDVDINIIAGDIAGSYKDEINFLNNLPEHNSIVIATAGNHLGYEFRKDSLCCQIPLLGTKDECISTIKNNLPENTYYLENEYIELNNIIVYGGVMYSDFNLYGTKQNNLCKQVAERWMNDFRLVHIYDNSLNVIRPINANDYSKRFKLFKKNLIKCLDNTKKDIIVISHFAPSKQSISPYYGHQGRSTWNNPGIELNAAYATNLEKFIKQNPRIKLWVHGHMHDSFDYKIGGCKVVCSPYGYKRDNCLKCPDYNGHLITL